MPSKPATTKNQKKPAPKPAARPAKAAAKPAAKAPAKPAPKAQPKAAAKPAAKSAQVKPAAKPDSKAAKAAGKGKPAAAPAKGAAAKPAVKEAPKKKLNVGQKPRSDRADLNLKPTAFITTPPADPAATAPKATPASKEAKQTFKVNDSIVYPAHGVGRVAAIEKQMIAGIANELFVIEFEQEKLRLKVPTAKAISVGMRGLSDEAQVKKAIDLLKGRARIKRTMWSRRAQEYEAKINSGDIMAVAEVVRDLYRATDQPEQSYSERQLFEAAQDRLAREVAAVRKSDLTKALADLDASLQQKKAA
jgi:CarD family transcriptional regulator